MVLLARLGRSARRVRLVLLTLSVRSLVLAHHQHRLVRLAPTLATPSSTATELFGFGMVLVGFRRMLVLLVRQARRVL